MLLIYPVLTQVQSLYDKNNVLSGLMIFDNLVHIYIPVYINIYHHNQNF